MPRGPGGARPPLIDQFWIALDAKGSEAPNRGEANQEAVMGLDVDRKLLASLMIMGSVVEARDAYTGDRKSVV